MKTAYVCEKCGKTVYRHKWQVLKHVFCSRECSREYLSHKMTEMNEKLNPNRMTPDTRKKLREARLGTGDGVTYEKTYGRHTHRIVAEQILGRPLRKSEVVHHINGDKRDNRPENLMVFNNQKEHAKWHAEHRGGDQTHGV